MKCPICNEELVYDDVCESCGAKPVNNKWVLICSTCNKQTDKLYDLFVPHHCKECSVKLHKEGVRNKDYCLICGCLRIDCCC